MNMHTFQSSASATVAKPHTRSFVGMDLLGKLHLPTNSTPSHMIDCTCFGENISHVY